MKCVAKCNRALLRVFYNYGCLVGKYPAPFIVLSLLLCGGLGAGFMFINPESDMEVLYTPKGSEAEKDRKIVIDTFPDQSAYNYHPFSLNTLVPQATIFFRSPPGKNILDPDSMAEIKRLSQLVKSINVTMGGNEYTYNDVCAKSSNSCVVSGEYIFSPQFRTLLEQGSLTYPVSSSFPGLDISGTIARPRITSAGILLSAGTIDISFPLRMDVEWHDVSLKWEEEFLNVVAKESYNTSHFEIAYSASESLNIELDKGTAGDIIFFAMTFTLMITYACIVSSGGNCVSTRALLSSAGVLASGLGIISSFGLISMLGVRFVNMVGIMPFLLLGIGVDDMFLLMSSWSETMGDVDLTVPQRIGLVFQKAGIGITITSVTDFLSFGVGATSVFLSVRNFCIYTGVGVLMCYFANATFFGGCLALHGRRVYASRHTLSCRRVGNSPRGLREQGRNWLYALICGGSVPERTMGDQSLCEKGPRLVLPDFVLWKPVRYVVLVIFAGYLGLSIWGITTLQQGLDLKDLVPRSSYVHKYQIWRAEDYGNKLPITFVTRETKDYLKKETLEDMSSLLRQAQKDIVINPNIEVCWLTEFAKTPLYNTTSKDAFFQGLHKFLAMTPKYHNDIVFSNQSITASRCHVYSVKLTETFAQARLMKRMRAVVKDSPAADFAYHPSFIFFEQFILILPSTMQTVGITLAVMMVVTAVFLPQPLIVVLVMIQVVMILTGIFGFIPIWGLTLSSITMVHLIMSVGFSVDFCAHVCTAYMVSEKATREERAKDAIIHASGPILNGGMSSMIGILGLIFSESFIFQSFFKIMLLVIGFGVLHAVFFVPVVLSFIGPKNYMESVDNEVFTNGHSRKRRDSSEVPSPQKSNGATDQRPDELGLSVLPPGDSKNGHVNKAFDGSDSRERNQANNVD